MEGLKLNYLVLGFKPLRVKFFYEGKFGYGEFYIDFSRETFDLNNPTDKLGVRGQAELLQKGEEYALPLLHALAGELARSENTEKWLKDYYLGNDQDRVLAESKERPIDEIPF